MKGRIHGVHPFERNGILKLNCQMIFQKLIIELLFKFRIKKHSVQVEGFNTIKNIVIIINLDEKKTCDLDALIHSFEVLGKNVECIGVTLIGKYFMKKGMKIVRNTDFSFFGKPKTAWIQQFFNMKTDYALLIDRSSNYLLNHVAIHCKANCYIGYKSAPENELLTLQLTALLEKEDEVFLRYIKLIEG